MKIALGADHRGHDILLQLTAELGGAGHELVSLDRADEEQRVDYPDMAWAVARAVASGQAERGITVSGSGIGSCIGANKVKGVRAALAHDELGAEVARRHHDTNVLCLGADLLGHRTIARVVETFLTTEAEGGRHARRVDMITALEAAVLTG